MNSAFGGTEKPLSFFLLVRSLDTGGTERQIVALANGLGARGHQVTVCTFYTGGVLAADLEGSVVRLISLGKKGRWDVLAFIARLVGAIRRGRPDILYTFLGVPNILGALVEPLIRPTVLAWGIRASDVDLSHYGWLAHMSYTVERMLAGRPDLIISNSNAGVEYAGRHGFPHERMVVVPNGIDTRRFHPDPDARELARHRLGAGPDAILVGTMSRLDPMKGLPDFLEAAALLSQRIPGIRFACIGEGAPAYRELLHQRASQLGITGCVSWPGHVSDPAAMLNALDIFCSPSISEGFSNSIGEAMACGIPCVVTDVGDSAMIVGESGHVAPRNDPVALSDAIGDAIQSRSAALSLQARERITESFSVDAMIDKTVAAAAVRKARR